MIDKRQSYYKYFYKFTFFSIYSSLLNYKFISPRYTLQLSIMYRLSSWGDIAFINITLYSSYLQHVACTKVLKYFLLNRVYNLQINVRSRPTTCSTTIMVGPDTLISVHFGFVHFINIYADRLYVKGIRDLHGFPMCLSNLSPAMQILTSTSSFK